MGCVFSRGGKREGSARPQGRSVQPQPYHHHQQQQQQALGAVFDARRGRYGPTDFDSGEIAIPPPHKPHKVSEPGTFIGRANIAGLEKSLRSTEDSMPRIIQRHIGTTVQHLISLAQKHFQGVMILHSELKRQRKLVKTLKKKSLWSRPLEDVVEKH
ncbi:hypothetical protein ZWY2020_000312 [Hordeum vulgare]|nr:hypothetical protein ZWY2020_000312 [Hordeum vulgare]